MSENSTSDIGRVVIDTYLDSVEQVLLAAHAPRSDRAQVLQDLESQIAEMLAKTPGPLTEEMVQSVIGKLEPPSHFAASYANGKQPSIAMPPRFARSLQVRWSHVAVVCIAVAVFGPLSELTYLIAGGNSGGEVLTLSILFGLVATPFALALAYQQILARPGQFPDRDFVTKLITGYAIIAPAFVMIVLTEWTYGLVLIPFGVVAVVYLIFKFVKRLLGFLAETLPPQSANVAPGNGSPREAAPPLGSAMSPAA